MKAFTRSIALLLLVLAAATAGAQSFSGTVTGVVTDEQGGALPGATVTLTGRTAARTTVTDARGEYRFTAVDPGSYEIGVELTGFRPMKRENVPVSIGKTAEGLFTMKVGAMTETVDVVGESPLVDVTSSATDNKLNQDILFNFPIRYGNVATALLNSLPAVNNGSAYGGDADSGNALLIDGVDTRDPSGGTAWTFYNFNIVEEVQAVGVGAPAEFGAFTGAVINTVTKSGGNRHSGLFDVTYTSDSLGSDNISDAVKLQNPTLADPAKTTELLDVTTQLSGPLIKDKLFFFLSAQRYHLQQNPSGPITLRDEVSPRFNGKLTWQPTTNDILTANVQFDSYNIIGRCGVTAAQCSDNLTNQEDAPEWVWLTQWRHLFGSNTFTEIKYTGWWGFFDLTPKVQAPVHFDGETSLYSVSQGWAYAADRGRHQVNAAISHFAEGWGRHDLKFGVEIERSRTRDRYLYNNNTYYYDYGGQPYYAYGYGYDINGRNRRESVFVQDSWKPTDRLTLNLGLRMDHLSGGAPGEDSVYTNTMFAPRLGFAFDLTGNHNTVLKGSYSQYYEGIFNEIYKLATTGYEDRITWNMAGCPAYDGGPSASYNCPLLDREEVNRITQPVGRIDDNIKHPRVDEWSLGIEHQIGQDWRISATGILRDNKNFIGNVLPDARWTPTSVTSSESPTIPDCPECQTLPATTVTAYRWANRDESAGNVLITNPDGFQYLDPNGNVLGTMNAYRKYKALMLSVSKRYADRWQGQVSYVYSKSEGTRDNLSTGSIAAQFTPFYATPTLGLVNADGRLTNDRPHEVKAYLGYEIPKLDISVNATYRMLSGRTYTPFQRFGSSAINFSVSAYYFGYAAGRQPLLEPRGSRRLPTERVLDLRLEKVFNVAGNHRLAVFADFLNLTNEGTVTGRLTRVPSTSLFLPPPAEPGTTEAIGFEAPSSIRAPRQINLGARWSF